MRRLTVGMANLVPADAFEEDRMTAPPRGLGQSCPALTGERRIRVPEGRKGYQTKP
jgi:hypothetical protein